ncbi:MAG: (2Fe-2S)-binding protein [Proteobacteria bacterium]|nr:(2Fe-2S)-binding protein [Pseudomonadota bacterium]
MVSLTINQSTVEAAEGALVLDVCLDLGLDIPTLCHRRELPSYGACRLCTVEVTQGGRTRLSAACSLPVAADMVVETESERVRTGRRIMAELLLARCPKNEQVRDLAARLGVTETRFTKRAVHVEEEEAEEEEGGLPPLTVHHPPATKEGDCVLCGLCVRACSELAGVHAIGFAGRGVNRRVATPFDRLSRTCVGCGTCTFVCPTHAIDMEGPALLRFRELSAERRFCRYMRMGIVSQKICPNDYRCGQCEYDQEMEDMMGTHPVLAAKPAKFKQLTPVDGLEYMPHYAYHPQIHAWVQAIGPVLKVGVDAFRIAFSRGIEGVGLPPVGTQVARGEPVIFLETPQGTFEVPCPVSGEVTAVNPDLAVQPELIGLDCYRRGWLLLIRPQNVDLELQFLIKGLGVPTWLTREFRRLRDCVPPGYDQHEDLGGVLAELDGETLASVGREFFHPSRPPGAAGPR